MHLADGRNLRITHPEQILAIGRTVTVFQPDGSSHTIELLLVTDIEVEPESASD
jgi:hypothetical protein